MQHENCNASFSQSISTDDLNFLTSAIITHFISILLSGEQLNYTHRSCLTLCSKSSIDMRSYLFLQDIRDLKPVEHLIDYAFAFEIAVY